MFEDPEAGDNVPPEKYGEEVVDYDYPTEINPAYTATLQRMIAKVKQILNNVETKPLVDDAAKELEQRIQVHYGSRLAQHMFCSQHINFSSGL